MAQGGHGRPAKTYSADVAVAWFELMYDRVKADGISPPVASRRYGIAGVAFYESIVPGMPGHASLGGQLNQLAAFTPPAQGTQFNWPTVANAALGRTLELLFSTSPNSLAAIVNLRNQLSAQLAQGVNAATTTQSVARGEQIANAIAAWASTDGFATVNQLPVHAAGRCRGSGFRRGRSLNPLQPCWGQLRHVRGSVRDELRAAASAHVLDGRRAPSSTHGARGLRHGEQPDDRAGDHRAVLGGWWRHRDAPGHWISIASQILASDSESLAKAAEAYARVGIAVADAGICCWNTKYQYNLIRPVSYIQHVHRSALDDVHRDSARTRSTRRDTRLQSGAASVVLTDVFGVRSFTDATHVEPQSRAQPRAAHVQLVRRGRGRSGAVAPLRRDSLLARESERARTGHVRGRDDPRDDHLLSVKARASSAGRSRPFARRPRRANLCRRSP